MAFSPDGGVVLTHSSDSKTTRLWNATTGQPIGTPSVHDGPVENAFFSPDGKTLLTSRYENRPRSGNGMGFEELGEMRLWDTGTAKPIGSPMQLNERVERVVFSPDGRIVLTTSESDTFLPTRHSTTRWWDATTAKPIGVPLNHGNSLGLVAFSPDGRNVLTGSNNVVRRWDATTAMAIGTPMLLQGKSFLVALSPDGHSALTDTGFVQGQSLRSTLQLRNVATGKPVGAPMENGSRYGLAEFSPDGRYVLRSDTDNTSRLCDTATGQPVGLPLEHQGPAQKAFSPDGRTVVTDSSSGLVLWDTDTRIPVGLPLESRVQGGFSSFAFSPDGLTVLNDDQMLGPRQLWDVETGKPLWGPKQDSDFFAHGPTRSTTTFSPDGKTIVRNGFPQGALWDAATGKRLGPAMTDQTPIVAAAFSPDGRAVLTAIGDETARLWDRATGKPIGLPFRHSKRIWAVAFSPDGRTALTGSEDQTARLWDAATGKPVGPPLSHRGEVTSVGFSPDGHTVLTGSWDKTAQLWDARTTKSIAHPLEHHDKVSSVDFSPDGHTALTGSWDKTARLWDATNGKPIGTPLSHPDKVLSVGFSPDGQSILTGCEDHLARLWDASTGQPVGTPLPNDDSVYVVAFSPDGRTAVTGGKAGRLWDLATCKPIGAPMEHRNPLAPQSPPSSLDAVAFSPDGKTIFTGNSSEGARFWDVATGKPLRVPLPQWGLAIEQTRMSPDGRTVLTYRMGDKTARLSNGTTGEPIGAPLVHADQIGYVVFSPDGRIVLTRSPERTARLWDAASGRPMGEPIVHQSQITRPVFSPDGRIVLTGSYDRTARLWDAASGKPLGTPLRHEGRVEEVAFSPDGRLVLTLSTEGAQLWDVATCKRLGPAMKAPLIGTSGAIAFSPNGRTIVTADQMGAARLWDITELPDDLNRVAAWVEATTGLEVDEQGEIRVLNNAAWQQRVERLQALGGPPPAWPRSSLDPILFGPSPTSRAESFVEQERWEEAGKAFDEAVRARPYNDAIRIERGRFRADRGMSALADADFVEAYGLGNRETPVLDLVTDTEARFLQACARDPEAASKLADHRAGRHLFRPVWSSVANAYIKAQGHPRWSSAAADYAVAVAYSPDDPVWHHRLLLTLLAAGDHAAARRARAEMLDRFGATTDTSKALAVAWTAALARGGSDRPDSPAFLVERALNNNTGYAYRVAPSDTQGAGLYRDGRHAEAIEKLMLGETRRKKLETTFPKQPVPGPSMVETLAWPFLAMAHHRLGHHEEARRWLDRFRDYKPDADTAASRARDPNAFWDEVEIRLLQSEAEATIVYDPVFPADPFAH
jgi:WD40 repeat protein/tetratricopeptide (TPR) repeat protein